MYQAEAHYRVSKARNGTMTIADTKAAIAESKALIENGFGAVLVKWADSFKTDGTRVIADVQINGKQKFAFINALQNNGVDALWCDLNKKDKISVCVKSLKSSKFAEKGFSRGIAGSVVYPVFA